MTHTAYVTGGEPLYDSEGLRVAGLQRDHTVLCQDCDYNEDAETVDQALELKYKHEVLNG